MDLPCRSYQQGEGHYPEIRKQSSVALHSKYKRLSTDVQQDSMTKEIQRDSPYPYMVGT
jgi:hypothetical protein